MNITIYKNFYKRTNSTKRPASNTGINLQCKLKNETSIENPTFILHIQENFEDINYVYALGHYYSVDDIVILDDNRIELNCTQDVLATYKDDIFNSTQFVNYGTSLGRLSDNDKIIDMRCTMLGTTTNNIVSTNFSSHMNSTGMFLLTVLNDKNNGQFTTTYLVDVSNMSIVANAFMNTNITWQNYFHNSYDVLNAVVSVKWIPFTFTASDFSTNDVPIYIGDFEVPASSGIRLSPNNRLVEYGHFTIPYKYTDFRRFSPFTKLSLYVPYYTVVDISTEMFANSDVMYYYFSLDVFTGDITLSISPYEPVGNEAPTRMLLNYNVAVEVPIAQMSTNIQSIISNSASAFVAGASAIATGNIGSVVSTASSLSNLASVSQIPITSVKGSIQGKSMSRFPQKLMLHVECKDTIEPSSYENVLGKPIMDKQTLSTFYTYTRPAYVQTEKASVNIAGRTSDSQRINTLLDSGIFLE